MLAADTSQQLLCRDNTNTKAICNAAYLGQPKPCVKTWIKTICVCSASSVLREDGYEQPKSIIFETNKCFWTGNQLILQF